MTLRPAQSSLRLPRAGGGTVVRGSTFDDAMQQIEAAIAVTVKEGTTPSLPALILAAPDGSSWRLLVRADGALYTTAVPR